MPQPTGKAKRSKAQILADIDSKLPALPIAQQNLVAVFAQGIRTGLTLRASLCPAPDSAAREPQKPR